MNVNKTQRFEFGNETSARGQLHLTGGGCYEESELPPGCLGRRQGTGGGNKDFLVYEKVQEESR